MANNTLTRGTKRIIKEAISHLPVEKKVNEYAICEEVSNILMKKFIGDIDDDNFSLTNKTYRLLEYQTTRMGLSTTCEIMEKIELYMIHLMKYGNKKSDT